MQWSPSTNTWFSCKPANMHNLAAVTAYVLDFPLFMFPLLMLLEAAFSVKVVSASLEAAPRGDRAAAGTIHHRDYIMLAPAISGVIFK